MRLWYRSVGQGESRRVHAPESPGEGWYELERDVSSGETVEITDGITTIVSGAKAPAAPDRRALLAAALPDLLLAVADGADLRDELKKVLSKTEAQRE